MQIQCCDLGGMPADGIPQLRLVQGLDASDRDMARLQARAALRNCLAAEQSCAEADLEISNLRNQPPQVWMRGQLQEALHCSVSHAPGLALLAWCWNGAVGVDIQAVDASASRAELQAVTQIFLSPKVAAVLTGIAVDALFFEKFADTWAQQEAVLKCAGLGLVEWSAELQMRLAGIRSASLSLLDGYAAAVAWSAGSFSGH